MNMALTRKQQVLLLIALLAAIVVITVYQRVTAPPPLTRPLTYTRGMTASAPVRRGIAAAGAATDPLTVLLERRVEAYPGVRRDLFRMSGDGAPRPRPVTVTRPVVTLPTPTAPPVPVKTPEEIAEEKARLDLSAFRFLGYLAEERDSSLFLSKDGELFIVKSGDTVLKSYRVKEAGRDYVVLEDTVTKVEVRASLTGSGK
jgi:hypothetical protein